MTVDERKKRVCVIGAGASGLPSIRHALLYGFEVVCYEGSNEIGGLWRYKPEETDESSVMKSTVINSSKEMTAYSDFPPPAEEANYMHNSHMYAYLKDYAEHFELRKYIKFNTKVLSVDRAGDYEKTGRWQITIQDNATGATSVEIFDGVLVCSGHHTTPHWPEKWPGQDKFKGQILHAHSYKDHRGYEDKTVVVVGVGNSGGDIAVELGRVAKQVYLIARRGTWVFNRICDFGRPLDCWLNIRLFAIMQHAVPLKMQEYMARKQLNRRFDHEVYGLKPKHEVFSAHPTINDDLPNRIISGTVRVKQQISEFTENGVKFTDGRSADVDAVVVCTGYSFDFPMLEKGELIKVKDNAVNLYQNVFPTNLTHDTLGVIGFIQPYGSVMPMSEMQARVVLDVIEGRSKLPSQAEKLEHIRQKREAMRARYVESRRHTIQVDYMSYMDSMAQLIGCSPPKWHELLFSDPSLALHILLAPVASYFYRLRGPHPWNGARQAILTIEDRMMKATNNTKTGTIFSTNNDAFALFLMLIVFAFVILAVLLSFIF